MAGRGSGWGKKAEEKESGRKFQPPQIHLERPTWMEWYDMVMIPVLIIAAILVIVNIEDVLIAFLNMTVVLLDIIFVLLAIGGIGLMVMLFFRGRRGRW